MGYRSADICQIIGVSFQKIKWQRKTKCGVRRIKAGKRGQIVCNTKGPSVSQKGLTSEHTAA